MKVHLFEPENLESDNLETQALALSGTASCCSSDGLDRDSCPLSSASSFQYWHTLNIAGLLFSALCMPGYAYLIICTVMMLYSMHLGWQGIALG